jgi:hypothetical protein
MTMSRKAAAVTAVQLRENALSRQKHRDDPGRANGELVASNAGRFTASRPSQSGIDYRIDDIDQDIGEDKGEGNQEGSCLQDRNVARRNGVIQQ